MKRAWTNSVSARVILAYVAGVVLSVLLLVAVIESLLRLKSPILVEENVTEHAQGLAERVVFDASGRPVGFRSDLDRVIWTFKSMKEDVAYRVLDDAGRVVFQSEAGDAFWPDLNALARWRETRRFDFDHDGTHFQGATEPLKKGDRVWFLQFAASARLTELLRLEFALPFMGIGIGLFSAILLFVFGVCAFITMAYVQRPLRAVSAAAAAISPRSLHARLPSEGVPVEIAPLVESFNRVLERVEHGYRVQQEFLATAAHELKTPLALIRAQIELLDAHSDRESLLQDVEHMTRQVQQLLLLAEASEAHNYAFGSTDVVGMAEEAAGYLQRMARGSGVSLELTAAGDEIRWLADRSALFTLLKNLLENAIQHAPAGTAVRVDVTSASLSVRDQGPGASADQLDKLFVRFWRGAHRRDQGAGLGLAICQEIAQAHGWSISAENAHPGLRVTVSLGKSPLR